MAQFKVIASRQKILEKLPDYEVLIEPLNQNVEVLYDGSVIAQSNDALLVKETRHADVVYLPPESLVEELFTATDHSTYCPFKGHASYWQLTVNDKVEDNVVWAYPTPYEEVLPLKDYVSFYTDRVELRLS